MPINSSRDLFNDFDLSSTFFVASRNKFYFCDYLIQIQNGSYSLVMKMKLKLAEDTGSRQGQ